ncbi:restriction endonuclease subunit S [Aquiflexum lacus]|uniref:restriction endonuclease subunit S n=1 Tax=Aquiflexum lacus TaxID=2483805 RepID=UPI001892DE03|nr:restriction endonuclease subunit S [Aquiflexum lacus]
MKVGQAQLPEGWEIKKLGEVCDLIGGGTPSKKNLKFYEGDIFWATVRDMKSEIISDTEFKITEEAVKKSSTNIIPKGNVIIATRVGLGKVCLIEKDTAINQDLRGIVPKKSKQLDNGFLFQWIKSISHLIVEEGTGATVQGVKLPFIKDLPIPIPPLPEQQRIVSILDEAFAAIAKAKANAEQNLKNAKELFESYLQGVFEKLFEERETKRISDVAKVIGGYSFKSGDFKKEGKYQVIRMGNVRPGIIRENESPVFIDELEEKALSKALLIPKDVIITQTGTKNKRDYGFTVIIERENYLLNQRIAAIRFKKEYLPKFFLYFSWTNIFKDQYFANETGTVGQGNVGIGAITDSQVPNIPFKEQQTIVHQLDALRDETQKLEAIYQKKLDDLEELKKSILQKAFAGELKTERGVEV